MNNKIIYDVAYATIEECISLSVKSYMDNVNNNNNNNLLINDIILIDFESESDNENIYKKRRDVIIRKDTSDVLDSNKLNKDITNSNKEDHQKISKQSKNKKYIVGENIKGLLDSKGSNKLLKKKSELQPHSPKSSTHVPRSNPRNNNYKQLQNNTPKQQLQNEQQKKSPIPKSIENNIHESNYILSQNENKLNDIKSKDAEVLLQDFQKNQYIRNSPKKQNDSNLMEFDKTKLIRTDDKITDDLFSEYILNKEAAKQYTRKAITIKEAIKKRSLELRADALKRRSEFKSKKYTGNYNNNDAKKIITNNEISNKDLSPRVPDSLQHSLRSHLTDKRKTSNKEPMDDTLSLLPDFNEKNGNIEENMKLDNDSVNSNTRFAGVSFKKISK
jgi:hypothetical protein